MTRKSECEVDNISVFNKLSSVTSKGTGKLDCILHRAQITIKKILLFFKTNKQKPQPKWKQKAANNSQQQNNKNPTQLFFKQCFSSAIPNGKYFILLLQKIKVANIEILCTV